MFKTACLVATAASGIAVIAGVMLVGATRRQRLARFATDLGGDSAPDAANVLQPAIDDLYADRQFWVGNVARFRSFDVEATSLDVYLFDLHARAEGPARRTAVLVRSGGREGEGAILQRLPGPSDSKRTPPRYETQTGETPTAELKDALSDVPETREWFLEYRWNERWQLVGTRDRPLSDRGEWEQLLETTRTLVAPPSSVN